METKNGYVRELTKAEKEFTPYDLRVRGLEPVPERYKHALARRGPGMKDEQARRDACKSARRKANKAARKSRRRNRKR